MGEPVNWIPVNVDTEKPNAARVYDYWLGGGNNFAVDREFGDRVAAVVPAHDFARMNRAFVGRVVRYLALEVGVRQFLDLGSGMPSVGSVHQVAQAVSADCRVVYVDNEPVAVAHSELLLKHTELATVILADLRHPATVLSHPNTRRLLDFTQPVAVLLCAVLHFVPGADDPPGIVAAYREALCPGSHLAVSHATADDFPVELAQAVDMYKQTNTPATLRTYEQILRLFNGFTVVEPGIVFTPQWRPDPSDNVADPRRSLCYGGLAVL